MDRDVKLRILNELGDLPVSVYDGLVEKFVLISGEQLVGIVQNVGCGDYDGAAQKAHSMKGAAANLRLHWIFEKVREMEDDIKRHLPQAVIAEKADALSQLLKKI
ncbi:MAG: Hpt domain-containing protein [Elusimicrobiaceae bacterium]|jgi:HPt (histidine-containing phosphotransfer) domain-containing protein